MLKDLRVVLFEKKYLRVTPGFYGAHMLLQKLWLS